jgi:hypothetical protein
MVGRLLVEVILPALAENCSREEHARPVGGGQRIDELSSLCCRKVLGDLEALYQSNCLAKPIGAARSTA